MAQGSVREGVGHEGSPAVYLPPSLSATVQADLVTSHREEETRT